MILKILLNYIFGYLNIRVESFFSERFINICISKSIFLWNIKREKAEIMYANVGIAEYKRLKEIAKKTSSKISIENKKGIPFIMHRYRKRKIFAGLLLLIIIGLVVSSNFIWNIEIEGEISFPEEELIRNLEEQGLKIGVAKSKIDTTYIINNIRLNRDDIAWIGISIKGTNARVEVREAKLPPEVISDAEYCNIVSDRAGIITKINVQNGTAEVVEGDIIKPGDILVRGIVEGKYTGVRYVHSLANIEAKVWYTKKEKVYLKTKIITETGNTEKKYGIKFNNFKINFYKTLSKFKKYDTINESKKLMLFSDFYLPIEIITIVNHEQTYTDVTYTEEEAVKLAEEKIGKEIEDGIKDKERILNKQVNTYGNEEFIEVEVIYEVLENIGVKERILF